eukprot:263412-Chlamydomonas_euryale.AAC.1
MAARSPLTQLPQYNDLEPASQIAHAPHAVAPAAELETSCMRWDAGAKVRDEGARISRLSVTWYPLCLYEPHGVRRWRRQHLRPPMPAFPMSLPVPVPNMSKSYPGPPLSHATKSLTLPFSVPHAWNLQR